MNRANNTIAMILFNSVVEVAPNTILVVYGADNRSSNPIPYDIIGTFFTVQAVPQP
jgi:hypothetical protein